jgi:hypothetical protein
MRDTIQRVKLQTAVGFQTAVRCGWAGKAQLRRYFEQLYTAAD